jgi:hypothetical protein
MLGNKVYAKFESLFKDYLFNFEQKNLHTSVLSGNIIMKDVNIRPDKVNEIFKKQNLPIALKAGLISKLNIKVITHSLNISLVQHTEFVLRFPQNHSRRRAFHCGANQHPHVKRRSKY